MWLGGEARKGVRLTMALGQWGCRLPCRWARGGRVAWPHPMEHNAQPHQGDQYQLVEKERRDHGKTPSYKSSNEGIVPGFRWRELAAGWRDTTTNSRPVLFNPLRIRSMIGMYKPSSARSPDNTSVASGIPKGSNDPIITLIWGRVGSSLLWPNCNRPPSVTS